MSEPENTMNADCSEHYDKEDDIYYVTFKTGEPSNIMEIDDILLVEVGIFTQMPTGFRILNFSKHNIKNVEFLTAKIEEAFAPIRQGLAEHFRARETQMETFLGRVLA